MELSWWVELEKGMLPFTDYLGLFSSVKEAQPEASELPHGFRKKGEKEVTLRIKAYALGKFIQVEDDIKDKLI